MMKKKLFFLIIIVYIGLFFSALHVCPADEKTASAPAEKKNHRELIVYYDHGSAENHYFPTERIGDAQALKFDDASTENPQSGQTCIKIEYQPVGDFGFAGIYWVNPKGNWGNQRGGYDLRFASKLTFWVRGEKGGEHIAVFKFGGLKGIYSDSDNHGIGPIVLTKDWQKITVDVSKRDMRRISAGFSFAVAKAYNRKGCIFYIDNIRYE